MVETLKASGHEVSLVVNTGSSSADHTPPSEDLPNGDQADTDRGGVAGGDGVLESPHAKSGPGFSANQIVDPFLTGTSQSTNYSDGSSQDTLDDIAESPASFEGDTDFSGMEKILLKSRVLDLHRTSSAPLTHREKAVALDASAESGSSSGGGRGEVKGSGDTASLNCLDGASGESGGVSVSSDNPSFESRIQMRTSSDGTVEKAKKQVSVCDMGSSPKRHCPWSTP